MENNTFGSADYLKVMEEQEEDEPAEHRLNADQCKSQFREQDIYLPIANVARIMKNAVPQNGKIAKDAKECVQECVSEFISFITSEASDRCAQEKRKTINGEDVLFAMATLGFDPYIEPLKIYLQKYRDTLKAEKGVSYSENQENPVVTESDIVDPFAPTQFVDILVSSEHNEIPSNVFSGQNSSLDQHMPFS